MRALLWGLLCVGCETTPTICDMSQPMDAQNVDLKVTQCATDVGAHCLSIPCCHGLECVGGVCAKTK